MLDIIKIALSNNSKPRQTKASPRNTSQGYKQV
jgi:hypothetical protein